MPRPTTPGPAAYGRTTADPVLKRTPSWTLKTTSIRVGAERGRMKQYATDVWGHGKPAASPVRESQRRRGECTLCMFSIALPFPSQGPGAYALTGALGAQPISQRPTSANARFGTAPRAYLRTLAVPGPASYEVGG
jgi:hypothetical protein